MLAYGPCRSAHTEMSHHSAYHGYRIHSLVRGNSLSGRCHYQRNNDGRRGWLTPRSFFPLEIQLFDSFRLRETKQLRRFPIDWARKFYELIDKPRATVRRYSKLLPFYLSQHYNNYPTHDLKERSEDLNQGIKKKVTNIVIWKSWLLFPNVYFQHYVT